MFDTIYGYLDRWLGLSLEGHDLGMGHVVLRGLVVFVFAVALARMSDKRMLGRNSGFDIVLLVMLGSVLSRAINGSAAFFPTLIVSAVLVALHHVVATLAFRSHFWSRLVKGDARTLVKHGKRDDRALARAKITPDDLDESLRLAAGVQGTSDVAEARLERNGTVSVVRRRDAGADR